MFIDVGSIKRASDTGIWIGYNQFCRQWLYPLLLYAHGLQDFKSFALNREDGITLQETADLLGSWPLFRFGAAIDYMIPRWLEKSRSLQNRSQRALEPKARTGSIDIQRLTIRRLRKLIRRIGRRNPRSSWTLYAEDHNYGSRQDEKIRFVDQALALVKPETLLDIGCNVGQVSRIPAVRGSAVVALDNDLASVDQLYRSCRESGSRVLPLCVDIANPSPPAGWENLERKSFLERMEGKFDCVSTLALIHHLLITRRVPLEFVVRLQSRLSRKFLLTEFVSRQDSKFKQLMLHRTDDFDYYTEEFFEGVHGKFFRIIRELEVKDPSRGLDRKLFLMEKIV